MSLPLEHGAEAKIDYNGDDFHLLHVAAVHNKVDLAQFFLERGCSIGMVTTKRKQYPRRYGEFARNLAPIGFACVEGYVHMVRFLLGSGATLELESPNLALLWTAAYIGGPDVTGSSDTAKPSVQKNWMAF